MQYLHNSNNKSVQSNDLKKSSKLSFSQSVLIKQSSFLALSLSATHSMATPAILLDTVNETPNNIEHQKISQQELMIIDARLQNIDNLIERRRNGLIPIIVQANENGLEAISQAMLKYPDATTIHVVSHGEPGKILLGNTAIDENQLNTKTGAIHQWRNDQVLARPDLIVYGCNVAKGQIGQDFINVLSQVTGFDVAASTDLTGQDSLGGDWQLESHTGWIDANLAWQDTDIKQIQGVLATITVNSLADSGAGTFRDALDNQVADGDTINFSVSGTILLTTGELTVANDITITGPGVANLSIDASGNSRVMTINRGLDVTISSVTITGGSVQGFGGGIRNYASYLNIQDSTIDNNFSGYFGGGISTRSYYGSSLTITNSTISNNSTRFAGGGLVMGSGTAVISDTIISSNTVYGNSGYSIGGGITFGYGAMTINNTTITGNTVNGSGGGIATYSRGYSSLNITGGSIRNNSANGGSGGGINIATYNYRPDKSSTDSVTISGNPGSRYYAGVHIDSVTIDGNISSRNGGGINIGSNNRVINKGADKGGRIYSSSSINNSTISNNTSNYSGGGVSLSAGYGGNLEISNSTISGNNSRRFGGGIALNNNNRQAKANKGKGYYYTQLDLINTTVTNNFTNNEGGGIDNSGYLSLQNSIVANNSSESGNVDINNNGGIILDSSIIGDSNFYGQVIDNGGNILDQDPLLGPLQDNGGPTFTHLLGNGSPAIDTGNNALVSVLNEQRGTGFTRVLNSRVDMGATEDHAGIQISDAVNATFTLSSIQVVETAGVVTYTINLDSPAPVGGVIINLNYSGTADQGSDYIPSGTQIVIPEGASSGSITFAIIDDGIEEPDETIVIEIVGIINAAVSGPTTATLTILASGPAAPAIIPSLSYWSTILLGLLLPAFVMRRFRKDKKVKISFS